ncbi:MAG: hypothetical protein KDE26_30110 [Bacteroidetes bacterium]|nr:hypothetical protein [Bacteroidota bacterium]
MKKPVFILSVPEYQVKIYSDTKEKISHPGTPWYNIEIPVVYWKNRPDFAAIGGKMDQCLKKHFLGQKVVIRALGSEEHPDKSIDDLIEIILQTGHDRYDPNRKGDRYENIENKHIDIFAMAFEIQQEGSYFEYFLEPFYFFPVAEQKKPVRVDIAIIYDPKQLVVVEHHYQGRENETKKDGFVFKYPDKKAEAILGIIKITG